MTEATVEGAELALQEEEPLGLALIRSLEETGELRRSGLVLKDPNITIQKLEVILAVLGQMGRSCRFGIGDALNFSEQLFGDDVYSDRYDRAVILTGLKFETLRNYASVCGRVAVSRRRDRLSFGHHETVAALEPQLQTEWLLAAESEGWSRSELRDRMKDANVLPGQSRIEWTGGALGSLAPEVQPPERSGAAERPEAPSGTPALPPAPVAQETLAGAVDAPLALVAGLRRLVEVAELLKGGFVPVRDDDPEGPQRPMWVGFALGEDHYMVPRTLLDQLAALVAVEE